MLHKEIRGVLVRNIRIGGEEVEENTKKVNAAIDEGEHHGGTYLYFGVSQGK